MNKRNVIPVLVLVGVALLTLAVACGGGVEEPPVPEPSEMTPEGGEGPDEHTGEELLADRCTRCHSLDRVMAASKSLDDWTATVNRMRGNGAELTDTEAGILVEHLAETYGP